MIYGANILKTNLRHLYGKWGVMGMNKILFNSALDHFLPDTLLRYIGNPAGDQLHFVLLLILWRFIVEISKCGIVQPGTVVICSSRTFVFAGTYVTLLEEYSGYAACHWIHALKGSMVTACSAGGTARTTVITAWCS